MQDLPYISSYCPLYINKTTNEVGIYNNIKCMPTDEARNFKKIEIKNPLDFIGTLETAELVDDNKNRFAIVEEAKSKTDQPGYHADDLVPYLVEAIKELSAKVEELEAKLQIQAKKSETQISDNVVKVYPNPVESKLNFEIKGMRNALFNLEIYDASGKILTTQKEYSSGEKLNFDISKFPTGIYYYRLLSDANSEIKTGKIQKL